MDELKLDYATPLVSPEAVPLRRLAMWHDIVGVILICWAVVETAFLPYLIHIHDLSKDAKLPLTVGAIELAFWFVVGILDCFSASFLRRKIHRRFSIVVAILNWLIFPFGTTLGIWAFIVLIRKSGSAAYAKSDAAITAPVPHH